MHFLRRTTALYLVFVLLGGCSNGDAGSAAGTDARQDNLRIVFVTHGQAADPFWSVVQNGARQAAEEVGVKVEYQSPDSFDMVAMAQLIDATVASRPDALVVTLVDPDALRRPVQKAMEAGIPVVSINAGHETAQELGLLTHVGQTEYEAGYQGGERMAAIGVEKALCVNHTIGNVALDQRCEGFADAMEEAGATTELVSAEVGDPTESQQRMQASLSDPEVDGLMTLGPSTVPSALRALRETDRRDQITMATFDLSPEILQGIEEGTIRFAIDQQQYLQGYLPVILLTLHLRNRSAFPDDVMRTGPAFVTEDNVDELQNLTERGLR